MPRGRILFISAWVLALMTIAGLLWAPTQYRWCGHKISLMQRWFPNSPLFQDHLCDAMEPVQYLQALAAARPLYPKEKGREPASAADFNGDAAWMLYFPSALSSGEDNDRRLKPVFSGSGKDWECRMDRTPGLPGFYLITADGTVHFNQSRPATHDDVTLPSQ